MKHFVSILVLWGVLSGALARTNERPWMGSGLTDSTEIVTLIIAKNQLRIPKAYIFSRAEWVSGETDGVILLAAWPGLRPYSKELASEFDKPGGSRIHLYIDYQASNRPTKRHIFDDYYNQYRTSEVRKGPYGFGVFEIGTNRQVLFKKLGEGNVKYLKCYREGEVPNPGCEGYVIIGNLSVRYSFQRKYLSQAKQIEVSVVKLIQSFLVNEPNQSGRTK